MDTVQPFVFHGSASLRFMWSLDQSKVEIPGSSCSFARDRIWTFPSSTIHHFDNVQLKLRLQWIRTFYTTNASDRWNINRSGKEFHIDQLHEFEKDQTTVQTLFFKIHLFNTIVNRIFERRCLRLQFTRRCT